MRHRKNHILFISILIGILLMHIPIPAEGAASSSSIGGINILKTDILGTELPGAGFQMAKEATRTELEDSTVSKRLLKAGDKMLTVVYCSFWDNRDMTGGKVSEVFTGSDGKAAIYGLPYGTYYLVESRAPEGYNLMTGPIRVTINKYSHLTAEDNIRDDEDVVIDNTLHILTIRYTLPDTGERASSNIYVAGISLMVSCVSLLILNKMRRYCIS